MASRRSNEFILLKLIQAINKANVKALIMLYSLVMKCIQEEENQVQKRPIKCFFPYACNFGGTIP